MNVMPPDISAGRRWDDAGVPAIAGADAIVVGCGAAGLAAALALAPRRVALLTKTATLAGGSTGLAQGGIAVALADGDAPARHAADTLAAGAGLSDRARVALLTRDGPARIRELIAAGMPFDRDAAGRLAFGREAAHGVRRILHAGGDATGNRLQHALAARVAASPSIALFPDSFAWDLVVVDGRVCGVLVHDARRGWRLHAAGHVVLATGGSGQLFDATTNPAEATADGLAMAARAGATLADLEFVQFHPTALALADRPDGTPLPLLTEALRGEGARLVDAAGAPLATGHAAGDLAPRDVVACAVWREIVAGRPVRLDARALFARDGGARFPTVAAICRSAGLDPATTPLPVVPAAHYHMGGVATDAHGATSLPGLWACGEVAATGVHGANRLASNSLLEALVFGHRVGAAIAAAGAAAASAALPAVAAPVLPDEPARWFAIAPALRRTMYAQVGLVRDRAGLAAAVASLAAWQAPLAAGPVAGPAGRSGAADPATIRRCGELRNLLCAGALVARAALDREESRGAHRRRDFPAAAPGRPRHSRVTPVAGHTVAARGAVAALAQNLTGQPCPT